jgi:hypothetical protein
MNTKFFVSFTAGLVMAGMWFSAGARAQDADWQPAPIRPRPHAATRVSADQDVPSPALVLNDDAAAPTPDAPAVESPSNRPAAAKKKKVVAADEVLTDEPQRAVRGTTTSPPRRAATTVERPETDGNEVFTPDDGEEGDFGYAVPRMRGLLARRLWFHGDALLWWARGGSTPPLLTTSPGSTAQAQAGVLGQPNTTILFGDQQLNTGLHAGSRMAFGMWLNDCEDSGIEFSYMILGSNTQAYSNSSTGIPILARPFFNTATGAQDSNLIAYPNSFGGTFTATSTENFQGAEALWRQALVHSNEGRIDLLAGYRFQRLTDGLEIGDSVTSSGTASAAPAGTTVNVADTFHTRNDFNGGELGFATQWRRNRWSLDTSLKLGIGQTNTQVLINGWTTVIANGTTAGYTGGQLALPSNIGTHSSNQFSMMPEIGFTLGYDLTPRLRATAGYTLLYWSNVARPGDQIDLNLDPAQFPPATATGTKPAFELHTSDFWAQGVNLGLDYHF